MELSQYGLLLKETNLKKYNTYQLNVKTKYLIKVNDIIKMTNLLKYLNDNNVKYFILGAGSNIILPNYYDGVIIKPEFNDFLIKGNIVEVGSSVYLNYLCQECIRNNLSGVEWMFGIPATLGGAIINNAGAYNDEIFNYIEEIEVIENNKVKLLKKNNIEYGYRYTSLKNKNIVIIKCILKLPKGNYEKSKKIIKDRLVKRKKTQPLDYPNAGSVFRNPDNNYAARLIELCGLKGKKQGGAMVSKKHANFIINNQNAKPEDIIDLIKYVHDKVLEEHNIDLIIEQQIIL